MARSDNRDNGRDGRNGRDSRERKNRKSSYSSQTIIIKKRLCSALDKHVFDYGHKTVINEIRTTWEKITQYVGTIYGQNIGNEL